MKYSALCRLDTVTPQPHNGFFHMLTEFDEPALGLARTCARTCSDLPSPSKSELGVGSVRGCCKSECSPIHVLGPSLGPSSETCRAVHQSHTEDSISPTVIQMCTHTEQSTRGFPPSRAPLRAWSTCTAARDNGSAEEPRARGMTPEPLIAGTLSRRGKGVNTPPCCETETSSKQIKSKK